MTGNRAEKSHLADSIARHDRPAGVHEQALAWKSDIVAQFLRDSGIPYVTLNPGASYRGLHDSLVNYLGNVAPQLLLCLNEDHVVSIAHGYAKATDRPLACILHSNVGLMHGLMGIFNAWADRTPMLVLGATGPVQPELRRPWIDWIHTTKDQGALLRNFVKWDDEPRSVPGLIEGLLRALQITTTAPRAPVYVCLDAGLQEERVESKIKLPSLDRFRAPNAPSGSTSEVERVAKLILSSQRPIFLMGRGSRSEDDWANRVMVAENTGAAVITSLRERAVFPTDHPCHIGPPSGWITTSAREALERTDLIISLDWVDLNGYLEQVNRNTSEIAAKIVHVSLDNTLHNGWSMDHFGLPPADEFILADSDQFVGALLPLVSRLNAKLARRKCWSDHINPAPCGYGQNGRVELVSHDIEVALAELHDEYKITLAHTPIGWLSTDFPFTGPLDYLGHDGGGGLAAGPGLTIGAALALKDSGRTVVGVLGDGDFLQGATALWTAAHYELPALFVVSNNRSHFTDENHQEAVAKVRNRRVENKWIGQRIDEPAVDLAALAKAQGVDAIGPVGNVDDLRKALRQGLDVVRRGKPFLIDASIKPGQRNILVARHR